MISRLFIYSSFFFFALFLSVEGAQFKTVISAVFTNVQPATPSNPYYDFCGWDCSGERNVKTENSYCDYSCRQKYNCKSFLGICFDSSAFWGPFCYRNCPGQFNNPVASNIHLRWGTPGSNSGQSGMGFSPFSTTVDVQQEFLIGSLTHYNFPIAGGSNVVSFSFIFTLSLFLNDGTQVVQPTAFTFPMNCDETPNNLTPSNCPGPYPVGKCPYPTRIPCNQRPQCADRISFVSQTNKQSFKIGDAQYTLAITGMRLPVDTVSTSDFISDEAQANTAKIYGIITLQCPNCPDGKETFWDTKTFTCRCLCSNTCPSGQVLQADCSCACAVNCGLNAKSNLVNGACKCDCKTGDNSQCLAPKVTSDCTDGSGKCCCNCPPNKCGPNGKSNPNTASCDCDCPTDSCKSKGPNWIASKADCSCQCPLSASNCNSDVQVFNPTTCNCDCKPVCPSDPGQMFTRNSNCFCNCDQAALTANCTAQNKETRYTPFDPKNPSAAQCKCGPCKTNYKPDANGICQCTLTNCTNQFVLDSNKCQCNCPAGGPKCEPPLIPDTATCSCLPCPTGKCNCPASVKADCDKLKRVYVFNSTFCGCQACENNFTDTDPKFATECTKCPLTDDSCKTVPKDLHYLNSSICLCQCPSNTTCPIVGDIYLPDKCACRSCLPGECVCGNGIVEAGEDCDNSTDPCCDKCKLLVDLPCKDNKCGICSKQTDNTLVCKNNSEKLCPSNECYTAVCVPSDGTCTITNHDDIACGDKNLCQRRCLNGKCQDYDQKTIDGRCQLSDAPNCTDCCVYECNPVDGKCIQNWATKYNKTCNDGLACTINDVCVNNTGNSSFPLKCTGVKKCTSESQGIPPPCMEWDCAEYLFGQCITSPTNNTNVPCAADGYCTLAGVCAPTGECLRPLRSCDSENPCTVGRCNEEVQSCQFLTDLADGLPCDDNDNCTENDVCVSGDCQGKQACNSTPPGTSIVVPLAVTAAVVAAAALVAGFLIYNAVQSANIMDPFSWGEVGNSQFDANPLYKEATNFGDNPLYQS